MKWFTKLIESIGKGLLTVTTGNAIAAVGGGLFWLFIASLLNPEEYGEVNYYLSIGLVSATLSLMGLNTTVTTFLAKGNERLRYQANLLVLFSTIMVLILLILLVNHLAAIVLLIGWSFFVMSWAEILGRKDYKRYSFMIIGQRVLQIFLSISLYFVIGINGIILGFALSALLFSYNFFKSFKGFKLEFNEIKQKFSFVGHSYSLAIASSVTIYADKLLIGPLFGFGILGFYQIGYQFLLLEAIIPISLFQFLLPREASQIPTKNILGKGLLVSLIVSTVFYFSLPLMISSFFPNFIESIMPAQIMSWGLIPMTATAIINSKLLGREKSKPIFITACIYISVLYGLIVILGTYFELVGLAFAVIISLTTKSSILFIFFKIEEKSSTARSL